MPARPGRRLAAALWLAAMAGVVVLSLTVIPQLLQKAPRPVPLGLALAASIAQSGLLLALAVWGGLRLSRPLGLAAPALEAAVMGRAAWPALRPQLAPALVAGLAIGALLLVLARIAPVALAAVNQGLDIPLAAKLLYGGVTEEVLMRWGLMTALIWLPWRLIQKRAGPPRRAFVLGAILASALLFGLLHLPAVMALGVRLSPAVLVYVIAGNTLPGILFGLLYWRRGLEAAILAHALAHGVAALAA